MTDMELTENLDTKTYVSQIEHINQEKTDESLSCFIPGFETFDEYLQEAYDALRAGIKAANNLPAGDNFNYYACFPSFNSVRKRDIKRMLATMQKIIRTAGGSENIENRDVEEKFDLLLETNDLLLDEANILMDEESGIVRNPQVELVVSQMPKLSVNGSWNARTVNEEFNNSEKVRLLGGNNIQRPQLMFKDKIDNSSKSWIPLIKDKPNSLKPLELYVEIGEHGEVYNHPYEFELNKFETPECQLGKTTPVKYKSLDSTKFRYIEKSSDIKVLLEDLKNHKELAIDLEHHSYRTFQGLTCLMQISTADADYIIDTLALRSELHQLNEIFTKPSILKVFHGADMDILWLQRDLSLYVVNMFDTHQAAKQLNLPYLSLSFLLKKYCGIDPNKHFQLADWRIRPLPMELIKYAREDTHYLLHIKDVLKNELIDAANGRNNLLKAVYDRSTDICKRIYTKPIWTEESCMSMYRKSQKLFNNKQMYALLQLHKWRDITAREEDDSIGYVLPNHMLLNIAETLPREMQGILACCNPIPPLVKQNLLKLHKIVLKAREQPLVTTVPEQDIRQNRSVQQNHMVDSATLLHMPHDIPSDTEPRADLPCLLDKNGLPRTKVKSQVTVTHTVTVFDTLLEGENTKDDNEKIIFVSPYMRYKCVMPMIIERETQERERQRKKEEEKKEEERVKVENIDAEIDESKEKVCEQISQAMSETAATLSKKKKKSTNVALGQMHGRKRKKDLIGRRETRDDDEFSVPTPSSDVQIVHRSKKIKKETIVKQEPQEDLVQLLSAGDAENVETLRLSRNRKKHEKKQCRNLLKQRGMLPSTNFDYKSVDFSSFAGGSTQNSAIQTQFQQPQLQKKEKHKRRKKQKRV